MAQQGTITDSQGKFVGKWFYNYRHLSFSSTSAELEAVLRTLREQGILTMHGPIRYFEATRLEILDALVASGFYSYMDGKEFEDYEVISKNFEFSWQNPRWYVMRSSDRKIVASLIFSKEGFTVMFSDDPQLTSIFDTFKQRGVDAIEATSIGNNTTHVGISQIPASEASFEDYSSALVEVGYEFVPAAIAEELIKE